MIWAWRKWKKVSFYVVASCAVAIVFYIYVNLCMYWEFRCHEYSVPIRIVEVFIVGSVLVWFIKRLIGSFKSD